ncbi:MAG: FeS-binding protein [SAR202 cluster bacterium]|nr:FeS-binding protein [SAR202 cluster bacterium]MQG36393.1 FeS-binding protein [SAR202 cluster bacterium]MQG87196.1 FeS-binding protein [SAR202 cluster bacterium]
MISKRYIFTFPTKMVTEPVIYNLGKDFEIETNIRRADVREDTGWVILELKGTEEEIEKGLNWVASKGVRVDSISGDLIQG